MQASMEIAGISTGIFIITGLAYRIFHTISQQYTATATETATATAPTIPPNSK